MGILVLCVDFVDSVRLRSWGVAEDDSEADRTETDVGGVEAGTGRVAEPAVTLSGTKSGGTLVGLLPQQPMGQRVGSHCTNPCFTGVSTRTVPGSRVCYW